MWITTIFKIHLHNHTKKVYNDWVAEQIDMEQQGILWFFVFFYGLMYSCWKTFGKKYHKDEFTHVSHNYQFRFQLHFVQVNKQKKSHA